MKSVRFEVKIPTEGSAYRWLMAKKEAGEHMSQSIRELIETHSDMFDRMESKDRHIQALQLKVAVLENQGSPDYRAMLNHQLENTIRERRGGFDQIKTEDKDQSQNDS